MSTALPLALLRNGFTARWRGLRVNDFVIGSFMLYLPVFILLKAIMHKIGCVLVIMHSIGVGTDVCEAVRRVIKKAMSKHASRKATTG